MPAQGGWVARARRPSWCDAARGRRPLRPEGDSRQLWLCAIPKRRWRAPRCRLRPGTPAASDGAMDETSATTTPSRDPLRRFVIPPKLPAPVNPALLEHTEKRARDVQNRIADTITRFAGSMTFVYLHVIWFACWIGFGVESYPYGLLTMIVSLEAIFLSTFVMISQNRADAKRQIIADQQWHTVQEEDDQNRQLLEISEQILDLTKAVHAYASEASAAAGAAVGASPARNGHKGP